jgi:hypothetical protein
MICQSEFISDSNFILLSREMCCFSRNRVRMSLRGTRQPQYNYFLVSLARIKNSPIETLSKRNISEPSGLWKNIFTISPIF